MSTVNPSFHYDYERKVFRRSVILAVLLHVLGFVFLFAGQKFLNKEPEMPPVMSVGLAGLNSLSGPSGKKTKAPVMRQTKSQPKKKVSQPVKRPAKKPKKNEVGLNKKKTTKKKTVKPSSAETNERIAENPGKQVKTGGTGGAADTGISFQMGGGQEGMRVEDLPYLAYLQSVQGELAQRWARTGLSGGVTTVTFRINRDGSIEDAEVSESSGKRHLDGPALRAVLGARLPPLPQGCQDDYLVLHYRFHYGDP